MVPGKPSDPVQYIDVRDVAEWIIRLAENKTSGTFNAVGPAKAQGIGDFVKESSTAFEAESDFVFLDDYDFLKNQQWIYILPWLILTDEYAASPRIKNPKAIAAALTYRALKNTSADILKWWNPEAETEESRQQFLDSPQNAMNREAELLEAWKVQSEA